MDISARKVAEINEKPLDLGIGRGCQNPIPIEGRQKIVGTNRAKCAVVNQTGQIGPQLFDILKNRIA